jgi:hypothetical protein
MINKYKLELNLIKNILNKVSEAKDINLKVAIINSIFNTLLMCLITTSIVVLRTDFNIQSIIITVIFTTIFSLIFNMLYCITEKYKFWNKKNKLKLKNLKVNLLSEQMMYSNKFLSEIIEDFNNLSDVSKNVIIKHGFSFQIKIKEKTKIADYNLLSLLIKEKYIVDGLGLESTYKLLSEYVEKIKKENNNEEVLFTLLDYFIETSSLEEFNYNREDLIMLIKDCNFSYENKKLLKRSLDIKELRISNNFNLDEEILLLKTII